MAWKPALANLDDHLFGERDSECSRDIETTRTQLVEGTCSAGSANWSNEEEAEIDALTNEFLQQTKGTAEEFQAFIFPTVRTFICDVYANIYSKQLSFFSCENSKWVGENGN